MDIERLKELKEAASNLEFIASVNPNWSHGRICGLSDDETEALADQAFNVVTRGIHELIDFYVSRQSVTSEEVQEAIEALKVCAWGNPDMSKQINLGIVALEAYQPWIDVGTEKPESEKPVLLLCEVRPIGRKYICVGFYAKPKSVIIPCDDDSNYEYDEETDEYYLVEGFYENIYNWCDYTSVAISDFVLGWKPLPPKGE